MLRSLSLLIVLMTAPIANAQLSPAAQAAVDAWRVNFEAAKAEAGRLPSSTLAQEMERRVRVEQAGRIGIGDIQAADLPPDEHQQAMDAAWAELGAVDAENTAWLKMVVPADGWFRNSRDGQNVTSGAWLIVQHSPDRQFQKSVLAKMAPLAVQGEVSGGVYALLYDRVQMFEGKPQRYGSQGKCVDGVLVLHTLEDADRVDALRAQVGLGPLAEYEKVLGIGRRC